MRGVVASRIAEKQAAGRLRKDLDPAVIGDVLVGTYEDFARRMVEMKDKPDLAAWTRSLLMLLYEGMLERSATAPLRAPRPNRRTSSS
jgi:hypothetical protein